MTHKDLALELTKENHRLVQRLMDARAFIATMRQIIKMGQSKGFRIGEYGCEEMAKCDEFMAAGLFGDRK